jgi:hypothetical protein
METLEQPRPVLDSDATLFEALCACSGGAAPLQDTDEGVPFPVYDEVD